MVSSVIASRIPRGYSKGYNGGRRLTDITPAASANTLSLPLSLQRRNQKARKM